MSDPALSPKSLMVRRELVEGLLLLLKRKSFAFITISEVCRKAGVSRMAFYRNFASP